MPETVWDVLPTRVVARDDSFRSMPAQGVEPAVL